MRRAIMLGLAFGVLGALAGCSSKYMKGTPLYTGEYPKREGPAEDRVNLWPLAYYRKPALSVLWPLMDATDDHLALRPFYSVYDLDKPHHEYNFLAPFAQFDYGANQHHVLPFDWGIDSAKNPYFNVLPLLWTGQTGTGNPYYVLFPLVWWYPAVQGVFPVFWSTTSLAVFPLVWYKKDEHLYAFPFWLHTQLKDGYDTHILWPIGRRMSTPAKGGFDVWPLVGAYRILESGTEWRRAYALGPLAGRERGGDCTNRWLFPLYFEGRNKTSSALGVFPLFYRDDEGGRRRTFTPLWSFGSDAKSRWDFVTPFYYRSKGEDESLTLSPVWLAGAKKDSHWETVPLAYYHRESPNESLTLSPIGSSGKSGDVTWRAAPPFYYERHNAATKTDLFLTPLVGWETTPEGMETTIIPLLSSLARRGEEKDLWLLAPLTHFRWGGERPHTHVFPLFYWDKEEETFLSLPYSQWGKPGSGPGIFNVLGLLAHYSNFGGAWSLTLPFALSEVGNGWDGSRVNILFGLLARAEWGKAKLRHHVFPLYAYDREEGRFLSPLVSWQSKPATSFFNVLGLLFHYQREQDNKSVRLLLPLTHFAWDKFSRKTTVLPLFSWSHEQRLADPAAPDRTESLWIAPWIWSGRTIRSNFAERAVGAPLRTGENRVSRFFPVWNFSGLKELATGQQQADFSLLGFLYDYEYRSRVEWRRAAPQVGQQAQGARQHAKRGDDPEDVSDYTRARILWRVMHYERTGGDSTLDVFPFITSDRRADGSRQVTFFWRLYRNQRTADGGRNLDVLFIPILRHRNATPAQAMR